MSRLAYSLALLVAVVAIAALALGTMPGTSQQTVSGNQVFSSPSNANNVASGSTEGKDPFFGPEDAKVTIIEYSDFQCPFCARAVPAVNQIKENYGDRVKLIYKNFPLSFHQFAQKAAEAGQCANEQGRFWEYHDILFENQNSLDVSNLKSYAAGIGLDTDSFNDCLDSGRYEDEVKADLNDGKVAGVSGTPTFIINGRSVVGAQPYEVFKQVIDEELAKA